MLLSVCHLSHIGACIVHPDMRVYHKNYGSGVVDCALAADTSRGRTCLDRHVAWGRRALSPGGSLSIFAKYRK